MRTSTQPANRGAYFGKMFGLKTPTIYPSVGYHLVIIPYSFTITPLSVIVPNRLEIKSPNHLGLACDFLVLQRHRSTLCLCSHWNISPARSNGVCYSYFLLSISLIGTSMNSSLVWTKVLFKQSIPMEVLYQCFQMILVVWSAMLKLR